MRKNFFIKLCTFIFFVSILSCEKKESESGIILNWLEYTDYIPLPGQDAMWISEITSEEIPLYGVVSNLRRTVTNRYFLSGDTTINNQLYKKVYNKRKIYTKNISENKETTDSSTVYSGGLRQDLPNKKVFFVFAQDKNEKLIYNFGVEVGDSVSFYTTQERKGKISCIDSILIANRYHTIFYVQIGGIKNSFCYIEGIGSSNGLITEPDGSLNGPWDIGFIEFKYKNDPIHIDWHSSLKNCF
jgi:hypothetical protein